MNHGRHCRSFATNNFLQTYSNQIVYKYLKDIITSFYRTDLENLKPKISSFQSVESSGRIKGVIVTIKGGSGGDGGGEKRLKTYDFLSRYFAPWNGIPEDPVTGMKIFFLETMQREMASSVFSFVFIFLVFTFHYLLFSSLLFSFMVSHIFLGLTFAIWPYLMCKAPLSHNLRNKLILLVYFPCKLNTIVLLIFKLTCTILWIGSAHTVLGGYWTKVLGKSKMVGKLKTLGCPIYIVSMFAESAESMNHFEK